MNQFLDGETMNQIMIAKYKKALEDIAQSKQQLLDIQEKYNLDDEDKNINNSMLMNYIQLETDMRKSLAKLQSKS